MAKVFDVYDSIGKVSFTTTPVTVGLDKIRKNSGTFSISPSSEIAVTLPGTYLFIFRVSTDINLSSTETVARIWLERNGVEVTGSSGYLGSNGKSTLEANQTATVQLVLDVNAADTFRIRATRVTKGNALNVYVTVAGASGLTILGL